MCVLRLPDAGVHGKQDVGGLPQEHGQAIARMGYTEEQTNTLQIATQKTWQKAVEKLAAAGGYNWQMFVRKPLSASLYYCTTQV